MATPSCDRYSVNEPAHPMAKTRSMEMTDAHLPSRRAGALPAGRCGGGEQDRDPEPERYFPNPNRPQ